LRRNGRAERAGRTARGLPRGHGQSIVYRFGQFPYAFRNSISSSCLSPSRGCRVPPIRPFINTHPVSRSRPIRTGGVKTCRAAFYNPYGRFPRAPSLHNRRSKKAGRYLPSVAISVRPPCPSPRRRSSSVSRPPSGFPSLSRKFETNVNPRERHATRINTSSPPHHHHPGCCTRRSRAAISSGFSSTETSKRKVPIKVLVSRKTEN